MIRACAVTLLFVVTAGYYVKASPTLELEKLQPAHGATCPGGDVVIVCNVTFSSRFFSLQWRDPMNLTTVAQFSYDQLPAPDIIFRGFVTTARAVPPDYTIHLTATLMGALLSHHNMVLQCWYTSLLSADVTVAIAGANNSPSALNITSSIGEPATLTWLPHASGSNCTFNYTVNITSNSSSMNEQVYNSTSLALTNLTRGENYSLAVAVTDSAGQYGAWSEELNITWSVPDKVNISVELTPTIISITWEAPTLIPHLPVLYYIVSHNVSSNKRVMVFNMNTTLEGAECGQIYYITVYAVNAVGEGLVSTPITVTVPAPSSTTCTTNTPDDTASVTAANLYTPEPNSAEVNSMLWTIPFHTVNPSGTRPTCSCVPVAVIYATVAALVSGVLSVIATSLIASCIMWCVVMRERQKRRDTSPGEQQSVHPQEIPSTELVEYEVPVLHQQNVITTQDNVAYGRKISLQQNVAYEQVHMLQ